MLVRERLGLRAIPADRRIPGQRRLAPITVHAYRHRPGEADGDPRLRAQRTQACRAGSHPAPNSRHSRGRRRRNLPRATADQEHLFPAGYRRLLLDVAADAILCSSGPAMSAGWFPIPVASADPAIRGRPHASATSRTLSSAGCNTIAAAVQCRTQPAGVPVHRPRARRTAHLARPGAGPLRRFRRSSESHYRQHRPVPRTGCVAPPVPVAIKGTRRCITYLPQRCHAHLRASRQLLRCEA